MISSHDFQNTAFDIITLLVWFLYVIVYLGISSTNINKYINDLQYYTKIYISLFLIIRFNPFAKTNITDLDVKIIFSAGLFLLTSVIYFENIVKYLHTKSQIDSPLSVF